MNPLKRHTGVAFAITSAIAIFLSAFLVFQVQPVMGKMILPWFGGTPAVWTTCMLFFQVLLLAGYAYAAILSRWKTPFWQAFVHVILLGGAILLLPITPGSQWKPPDSELPTTRILWMLTICAGGPYFLLSATSPLIQAWFAHVYPGRSPYRLYTLSNIGSLGALLTYPVFFETILTTNQQGVLWSITFIVFVLSGVMLAWELNGVVSSQSTEATLQPDDNNSQRDHSHPKANTPSWQDRFLWLLFSALASWMLLAITNYLCQDVAVIPFLWIVPLSLYLVSLIVCFDRDQWYVPRWYAIGTILCILAACDLAFLAFLRYFREPGTTSRWDFLLNDIRVGLGIYLALFFLLCMVCHGEVVRRRPTASRLTEFYLTVSAGGALGGIFVAIVCPMLFTSFDELKIGVVLGTCLCLWTLFTDAKRVWFPAPSRIIKLASYTLGVVLVLVVVVAQWGHNNNLGALAQVRNFYGVLTVREWFPDEPERRGKALYHGAIVHGYQFHAPEKHLKPTTYYGAGSGIACVLSSSDPAAKPRKVGVVGLGIGTLAAYGKTGDVYRFYEINPLVTELAKSQFTFLSSSKADIEIVSGDARISLEREPAQKFDVLVLDAFSGDSIPVHLLTSEAIELYRKHLNENGIIAIHASNRYADLCSVVNKLSKAHGLFQVLINQPQALTMEKSPSDWMLLANNKEALEQSNIQKFKSIRGFNESFPVWSDQHNNLFQILRDARY